MIASKISSTRQTSNGKYRRLMNTSKQSHAKIFLKIFRRFLLSFSGAKNCWKMNEELTIDSLQIFSERILFIFSALNLQLFVLQHKNICTRMCCKKEVKSYAFCSLHLFMNIQEWKSDYKYFCLHSLWIILTHEKSCSWNTACRVNKHANNKWRVLLPNVPSECWYAHLTKCIAFHFPVSTALGSWYAQGFCLLNSGNKNYFSFARIKSHCVYSFSLLTQQNLIKNAT